MKAISLWQPWASAFCAGLKTIETRDWRTNWVGPIAIHAAKKWNAELRHYAYERMKENKSSWIEIGAIGTESLSFGAVVATAYLERCQPTEDLVSKLNPLEIAWGNYGSGRFGWVMRDIKMISPIPYRGEQGLFNIPDMVFSS